MNSPFDSVCKKRLNGSNTNGDDVAVKRKKTAPNFNLRKLSAPDGFGRTNDEVHSSISFCPVMRAFMDTMPVQRLRKLKQNATADYVYMNTNHTRFEHSMGVAYVAEKMAKRIQSKQRQLGITDKDVLCLKLAGLCHDLGHGPFSHIYDGLFRKTLLAHLKSDRRKSLQAEYEKTFGSFKFDKEWENWEHEEGSVMMIHEILAEMGLSIDLDNLDEPLKQIGDGIDRYSMRVFSEWENEDMDSKPPSTDNVITSRDIIFITECITAEPHKSAAGRDIAEDESGFIGRPKRSQEYLYDIVSNRHNGLDVDKIDYFARDQRRAMRDAGEIELRMVEEVVVAWGKCPKPHTCFRCKDTYAKEHLMVCYPQKMISQSIKFFEKRFELHTSIYQHKTSVGAALMIIDILLAADPYFKIPTFLEDDDESDGSCSHGSNDTPMFVPISRAMEHEKSYLRLRDDIIGQIMAATSIPELKKAQKLCLRLEKRDLYKCAASRNIDVSVSIEKAMWEKSEAQIIDELIKLKGVHSEKNGELITLEKDDIIVDKNKERHHGAKEANPLTHMRFLPKPELWKLSKPVDQLPEALQPNVEDHNAQTPKAFRQLCLRLYCRGSAEKVDLLKHVYELWEKELDTQLQTPDVAQCDYGSDDQQPIQCTQESLDGSPYKDNYTGYAQGQPSPSPLPAARSNDGGRPFARLQPRKLLKIEEDQY